MLRLLSGEPLPELLPISVDGNDNEDEAAVATLPASTTLLLLLPDPDAGRRTRLIPVAMFASLGSVVDWETDYHRSSRGGGGHVVPCIGDKLSTSR